MAQPNATFGAAGRTPLTLPGVRAELAAAVRAVNAKFARLPADVRGAIEIGLDGLEDEIDQAILASDCDRAEVAIRAWRSHWLATFEETAG